MSTETETTISLAYDEFLASKGRARKIAKAEYERVLADEQRKDREEFSRRLQIAHAQGMTKADLRVATRQYNNPGFKALFDAYEAAPGEFDRFNPAILAAAANEQAQQFHVTDVELFPGEDVPEWLVLTNDDGASERVYVAAPAHLDRYANHYSNNPAAVEAARAYLADKGLL